MNKCRRKHIVTIKVAGRNRLCAQHKKNFSSTDLRDVNAIPTKEKQQKEVQSLK